MSKKSGGENHKELTEICVNVFSEYGICTYADLDSELEEGLES